MVYGILAGNKLHLSVYALGYAIERVLSISRTGIGGFLAKKVKSQQLNLFEHFKIENIGHLYFKNGKLKKCFFIDRSAHFCYNR